MITVAGSADADGLGSFGLYRAVRIRGAGPWSAELSRALCGGAKTVSGLMTSTTSSWSASRCALAKRLERFDREAIDAVTGTPVKPMPQSIARRRSLGAELPCGPCSKVWRMCWATAAMKRRACLARLETLGSRTCASHRRSGCGWRAARYRPLWRPDRHRGPCQRAGSRPASLTGCMAASHAPAAAWAVRSIGSKRSLGVRSYWGSP